MPSKSGGAICTDITVWLYQQVCQGPETSRRFRLVPFDVSLKAANDERVPSMSANVTSLATSLRPADTATSAFNWGRNTPTGLLSIGAAVLGRRRVLLPGPGRRGAAPGRVADRADTRLMEVMAPDVVLTADGGGLVPAARTPIRGAENVARLLARAPGAGHVEDLRHWTDRTRRKATGTGQLQSVWAAACHVEAHSSQTRVFHDRSR